MRTINKIIIHCSDTPSSMDIGTKEIRKWHVEENNWSDIGYHYVVGRDGEVGVGRGESTKGAHCYGQNSSSIGICLVGREDFNDEQFSSLRKLINDLVERYNIIAVEGHYKYSDKTCPNFDVHEWYNGIQS